MLARSLFSFKQDILQQCDPAIRNKFELFDNDQEEIVFNTEIED